MCCKPVAVVVGATGKQGTGIVNALLAAGKFNVKALTRDPHSAASSHLSTLGAELCQSSPADVNCLRNHFAGAQAVFGQTPHNVPEEFEIAAALAQAKAAHAAGVESFVFSSLENVEERSKGKYHVPYFSAKAQAVAQIKTQYPSLPMTVVQMAYFYTNFLERFRPRQDEKGTWVFTLPVPPDATLPWTDPMTSLAPIVNAVFSNPEKYSGLTIPVVSDLLTPSTMAEQFSQVTGLKARYQEMTKVELLGWGLPESMAQWQWDMYQYTIHMGYYAPERDLSLSRKIDPECLSWKGFLHSTAFDGSQTLADIRAQQHQ